MAQGLSHITLITADLDRMEGLLVGVLKARKVYDSGEATFSHSKERFFLIGDAAGACEAPAPIWIATMEGPSLAARSYNHIAFKINESDIEPARAAISALGYEILPGRSRVSGEGLSIYFYDFDGHLIELHTGTLAERLARYAVGNPPV